MKAYLKLGAKVVATVLAALVPLLGVGGGPTAQQWLNVAIIGVGACAVFAAPNIPGAAYTKAVLALLTACLTVAATAIVGGFSSAEIIQIVLAGLGAIGVVAVPNLDKNGNNLSNTEGPHRPRDARGRFVSIDGKDVD